MKELADTNLLKAQEQQKVWYDRNTRKREFQCNDMVLLLLPTSTNKLLAKWHIETPNHRRRKEFMMSLLHTIMLPLRLMGLIIVTVVLMKVPLLKVSCPTIEEELSVRTTVVPTA